jgi:hypothetical protein
MIITAKNIIKQVILHFYLTFEISCGLFLCHLIIYEMCSVIVILAHLLKNGKYEKIEEK